MKLNEDQQQAHDVLIDFILGRNESAEMYKMFLLEGYAGTGKTFTVTKVVQTLVQFEQKSLKIAMSAPTHKAVKVLRKFSTMGDAVTFATIHSLLGLKEKVNENTGKVTFERDDFDDEPRINEFDVLFLDEASMLQDELFLYLVPYVNQIKIVFIGDPIQIPPVKDRKDKNPNLNSIPFSAAHRKTYGIGQVILTNIVRQAEGNPILKYATDIRKVYKNGTAIPVPGKGMNGEGITLIDGTREDHVMRELTYMFCCDEFHNNPDHAKVIAWKNPTVNAVNKIVRELIYKQNNLPILMEGDSLVMDKPVFSQGLRRRIIMHTSDEVIVKEFVKEGDVVNFYEMDAARNILESAIFIYYYDTKVEYEDIDGKKLLFNIRIVHDESVQEYERIVKSTADCANKCFDRSKKRDIWKRFWDMQKMFAQVKYNYAITAHKSQGSTYDRCMVFEWDIDTHWIIEERNRIKYVAATRPRKELIIVT